MAYDVRKISPLDLKPSTAIGVSLPFSAANVFTPVYTTKDQIKYNLINFLLTNPRERIFNPSFGSGLRSRLFEQIDRPSLEEIQESLAGQIENNFPQIEVVDFSISPDPDNHILDIKFSYKIKTANDSDNLSLVIQTL